MRGNLLGRAYAKTYRAVQTGFIRSGLNHTPLKRLAWSVERRVRGALGQEVPNPTTVDGFVFFHTGRDFWSVPPAIAGDYEPETTALIRKLLQPGMGFADIGASLGFFSLVAAEIVGSAGRVWAFEPEPLSYSLLVENVRANGFEDRVAAVPCAVSADCGTRTFFRGRDDIFLSSLHKRPDARYCEADAVNTTTLDTFYREQGWPAVHLVKMDIEGNEKAALDGMAEVLRRNPSLKVVAEFGPRCMRAANVAPEQLFSTLDDCGLSRISLIDKTLRPLAVPRDLPWLVRRALRGANTNLLCETTCDDRDTP